MITRFATLTSRLSVLFAFLLALTACGGGGGGGGGGFLPDDGSDDETYFLSLALLDILGEPTNTVTSTKPATLQVKVTRKSRNGAAVADVLVSVEAGTGAVSPGSALTDAEGMAVFDVEVGDAEPGAGQLLVSVENPDGGVTEESINFQITPPGLRLGHFEDGVFLENEIGVTPSSGALSYQGSAELYIDIVDEDGNRADTAETVVLSSDCLDTGAAGLEPASPLETSTGFTSTTYTASTCTGADEITARLEGGDGVAFASLSIGSPQANSLVFTSAEPTTISIRGVTGTSGLQHSSVITFTVIDANNQPVSGIEVDFALSTTVGGLSLQPLSDVSDAEGQVTTTVSSGTVATAVRVIASIESQSSGAPLSTVSDALSVSTGLPDQNSISVTVEGDFLIEHGLTVNGVTRNIVAYMADRFNNPVPDGTTAQFTTEYGSIDPSCTTTNGQCTVVWRSQNPRFPALTGLGGVRRIDEPAGYSCPSHNGTVGPCPDDLGSVRGGRSTILVTAIGEESFLDSNGNGIMDRAERNQFSNLPEAFIDNNENGFYSPSAEETFIDFNGDNNYNTNTSPALYNGSACPQEGDGDWCSRTLLNVFASGQVILSDGDNGWYIIFVDSSGNIINDGDELEEGASYSVYISDVYNNRPPAGSTVTVTGAGGCEIRESGDFPVRNTHNAGAFGLTFTVSNKSGDSEGSQTPQGCPVETGSGTFDVQFSPSDGTLPLSAQFSCDWRNDADQEAPADPNAPLSC